MLLIVEVGERPEHTVVVPQIHFEVCWGQLCLK